MFYPTLIKSVITERKLADGVEITRQGSALVSEIVNGELVVKPSTGSGAEVFEGFAYYDTANQELGVTNDVFEIEETITANATLNLTRTPSTNKIGLYKVVKGVTSFVADSSYSISKNVVTVTGGVAKGETYYALYNYDLTVKELIAFNKQPTINFNASQQLGSVPVVIMGEAETDVYETSDDWTSVTSSTKLKLGSGGRLTISGSGAELENVKILRVPTATNPLLKIMYK